jgi:hypothetical protein
MEENNNQSGEEFNRNVIYDHQDENTLATKLVNSVTVINISVEQIIDCSSNNENVKY